MFKKLFLLSFVFAVVSAECDPSACPGLPKHYKDLGCTPITPSGECCVQRYECETKYLDDSKCHIGPNSYAEKESVPDNDLKGLCITSCYCAKNTAVAEFQCAHIDCPEFFRPYDPKCISQKSHDSCCSVNTICEQAVIDKLATCYFEDKTYREGQKMYPTKDNCLHCICAPNYDNSTIIGNPNCQEYSCGDKHLHAAKYRSGCIPIYRESSLCCPWGWKCPSDKDTLIPAVGRTPAAENDPKLTCKFGKLNLKLGDKISDANTCTECKCSVPPMAHCIEKDCLIVGTGK